MAGAGVLFLVGTNVQSGWVLVMCALLLGTVAAGVLLPRRMVKAIAVERRAPAEAFPGDEVRVQLVVSNPGRRPKVSLSIRDPHIAAATAFVPWLGPGEIVTASTVRVARRRGVTEGGSVEVSSSAPFGVATARRQVAASGRTVVFPRVVPADGLRVLGASRKGAEGDRAAGRGPGHEVHGVREYQSGDSLRHVHWPSTARHGALIVREFERERPARLVVVVDTWADAREPPDADEGALDLCCAAAASVALEALRQGRGVSVAASRDGAVTAVPDADRREVLTMLAELRAPGGVPFPDAVAGAAAALPGSAGLLLAFPTWRTNAAPDLLGAVAGLASGGVDVAAVVVDASTLRPTVPVLAPGEVDELAWELAAAGAEVVLVRPGEDLAATLGGAAVGVP